MKTKFNGMLTLLLALMVQFSFAQEKTISGTVSDNSGALPGVSVVVKGTAVGTETDFDGKYTIKAKAGDILSFSYLGYKTIEKTVGSSNTVNATMEEDENVLDEVVVTAQGIKRSKKSLGYSQQSVKGEDLTKTLETNVANAMAGKIAGVQLVGAPSSGFKSAKIRLRGNTDVLYIVDNIKLSDLGSINTEDIENISTLKGLAATAIYGPDGRNGVVIITTKTAKNGDSKIIVNTGFTVDKVTNLMDTQNEYGGGYSQTWDTFDYNPTLHPTSWAAFDGHKTPYYAADESWGPKLDGTLVRHWDSWIEGDDEFGKLRAWSAQPDNIENFFRIGTTQRTSLTALKGGEGYNVKAQLTHTKRESIMPNSDRTTTQASFNANYNITDKFEVFANINYQLRRTNNELQENYGNVFSNINQWWQRQIDIDRVRNYRRNGKIVSWNINGPTDTSPKYWDSPFFDVYENTNMNSRNTVYGKIGGNYKIDDNFSATFEIRTQATTFASNNQTGWGNLGGKAAYGEFDSTNFKEEYFAILNYQKNINEDFDVSASVGGEITNNTYRSISASSSGGLTTDGYYSLNTSVDKPNLSSFKQNTKNKAVFLKASAGYKNLLYIDGSYRMDWSSTANPNLNVVHTKSLSSSFIFSKLIEDNSVLSFGKFRAGVSEAPYFPGAYRLSSSYQVVNGAGSRPALNVPGALNNPTLEGGERQEIEFGTELKFFRNRVGVDISYYTKTDKNLPVGLTLDPATGNTSVNVNSGKQTYKGFELAISGTPFETDNFTWNTSINFATLERTVNELALGIENNYLAAYSFAANYWGNESMINMQERVGQEWGAIYGKRIKRNAEGKVYINPNGTYVKEEAQYLGNHLPDFTGGFTNNFRYKNFSLSLGIDFQKGGKFFSMTDMFGKASGNHISTVGNNALGNPVRDPLLDASGSPAAGGAILVSNTGAASGGKLINGVDPTTGNDVSYYVDLNSDGWNKFAIGDEFLYDSSYIKLRTVALSYNFPKTFLTKLGIQDAKIGVYANNVWLIYSKVPYLDPSELESPNSAGNGGHSFIEGGQAPGSKSFGLNLNFTF